MVRCPSCIMKWMDLLNCIRHLQMIHSHFFLHRRVESKRERVRCKGDDLCEGCEFTTKMDCRLRTCS